MINNNKKDAVRNLQTYLRQLSYTDSDIASPPIDGIFNTVTKNSLTAFQRKNGLYPSGIADRETWNKLYEEYLRSLKSNGIPTPLSLFPRVPDNYSIALGDEYFLVSIIQLLLNELRIIYDSFIPLIINGIYDEATENNVMDFQRKNQLSPSGLLDKETWNKLVEAYHNYASDYVR